MNHLLNRLMSDVALVTEDTLTGWMNPSPGFEQAIGAAYAKMVDRVLSANEWVAGEDGWTTKMRESLKPKPRMVNGVQVIPMHGPIAYAPDVMEMMFYGMEDSRALHEAVTKAGDDSTVKAVVLDINSPGGMVSGGSDVADAVAQLAKKKPVVAYSGGMMASLGYMIGSQANSVVTSPSATVGSIGVIMVNRDMSRLLKNAGIETNVIRNKEAVHKGAGVGRPITDEQMAHLQEKADSVFQEFKAMVRAKRPNVPDSAMLGQTFYGKEAKGNGLVDVCGTMDSAISLCRRLTT